MNRVTGPSIILIGLLSASAGPATAQVDREAIDGEPTPVEAERAPVEVEPPPVAAERGPIDGVLAEPGDVQADAVHGRIGDWFALRTLHGEVIPYDAFEGRVLFVNFWATWCAPCVEEMPTIVELARSLGESDVAFLLVSIDDDERAARRFAETHDLSRFVYFRGWEPWTSTFTAGIVPATFVVARDGSIVYQHHGAADWNTDRIRRFLREKSSG